MLGIAGSQFLQIAEDGDGLVGIARFSSKWASEWAVSGRIARRHV